MTCRSAILALAHLVGGGASVSEQVVSLHGDRYRVQALSTALLRVEQEGPHGFVDNVTFLVVNRSWLGIQLEVAVKAADVVVLSTPAYTLTLSLPSLTTCPNHSVGSDAASPVRTAKYAKGAGKVSGADACCQVCRGDPECEAWVFGSSDANATADCWPLSEVGSSKASQGRILGTPQSVMVNITGPSGALLYHGALKSVPAQPQLPSPSELTHQQSVSVWALRDAPRFVPPARGPTPPAAGFAGPFASTSGFDVSNAADDAYFFLASPGLRGHADLRKEVLKLLGPIPPLPDFAFGTWFTWNHNYSQQEKVAEIQRWLDDDLPLEVVSLDMDWRHHENNTASRNYTVDERLFPDMPGFMEWVHGKGLKLFFNDHPMPWAAQMAPKEVKSRYRGLVKILELGLDFWWFDCHWRPSIPGITLRGGDLDYITWGQYIVQSAERRFNAEKRPRGTSLMLGCSNSNHWASHRFPVWWTGDNTWTSLAQGIRDEISYGLQLKPYVHPDCSGHTSPEVSSLGHYPKEVYARWVQFCSLGTILRIHSKPNGPRQPWVFGNETEAIARTFLKMRRALSPTLIAAGQRASEDGMPLVRRLDFEWPQEPNALRDDQYLLGDDTLVAPIDPFANGGKEGAWNRGREVWLPPGRWHDAFTGEVLYGAAVLQLKNMAVDRAPLYHREGGLVALAGESDSSFVLEAWPSSDVSAARTRRRVGHVGQAVLVHGPAPAVHILPSCESSWTVRFHLVPGNGLATVSADGAALGSCRTRNAPCITVLEAAGVAVPFQGVGSHPARGVVVEVLLPASRAERRIELALAPSLELVL